MPEQNQTNLFSQTTEYALRATVILARHPQGRLSAKEIAQEGKIPPLYAAKVLQQLTHAKIARSQRGIGGGFSLARNPSEISMLEVVTAIEPLKRITRCPLELTAHKVNLCALHQSLDKAIETLESMLSKITLSRLLEEDLTHQNVCAGLMTDLTTLGS